MYFNSGSCSVVGGLPLRTVSTYYHEAYSLVAYKLGMWEIQRYLLDQFRLYFRMLRKKIEGPCLNERVKSIPSIALSVAIIHELTNRIAVVSRPAMKKLRRISRRTSSGYNIAHRLVSYSMAQYSES